MVRLTDFSAQPPVFPPFYSNQLQQQQNAMPLSPVQPVSIVMNTQSAVPPSLPQPQIQIEQSFPAPAPVQSMQSVSVPVSVPQQQAEQSSPEWQKTSAEDTPTASVFQTEQQQQVEEKVGRIEDLENDGAWLKWNKNLTENYPQSLI